MRPLFTLCFFGLATGLIAQSVIAGKVTDRESREPLELVTIYRQGTTQVVETDANGK